MNPNYYLIIYQDLSVDRSNKLDSELLTFADFGAITIIDITDPEQPLRYFDEGWCDVDLRPKQKN